jgi:hypothetical protein
MLWTEYQYRDVVSNGLLFLMDGFVYVILTGLVFRLLLDADPKHAKIPRIRIEIHVGSVEGQRRRRVVAESRLRPFVKTRNRLVAASLYRKELGHVGGGWSPVNRLESPSTVARTCASVESFSLSVQ